MNSNFKYYSLISSGSWVPENLPENEEKANTTYKIIITDLVLSALIGIHPHEKDKRQKILINILINAPHNFNKNIEDINEVVSYEHIVNDIKSFDKKGHVGLLENLAESIVEICFFDKRVLDVRVKIEKLEVFKETKSVGIEIYKTKNYSSDSSKKKILKIKKK